MKLVIEKDAAIRSFTPSDFRVPETWKNHIKQAWWDLIDDFQRHTGERILKLLGDWKKELATVGEK
jgi:hypothetical protein